jgi:UPF0755 protein
MNNRPADDKPSPQSAGGPSPQRPATPVPPRPAPQPETQQTIVSSSRQAGSAIQAALRNLAAQGLAQSTPDIAAKPAGAQIAPSAAAVSPAAAPKQEPAAAPKPQATASPASAGGAPVSSPVRSGGLATRQPTLQTPNQTPVAPQNPPSPPASPLASPVASAPAATAATGVRTDELSKAAPARPAVQASRPAAQPAAAAAARLAAPANAAGKAAPPRSATSFSAPQLDPLRMTPRSPRTALEPERVKVPPKRSQRARNPIVMIGNAIFTVILLLAVSIGGIVFWAKHRFETPGPLPDDKTVNIRPGGIRDIAEVLQREGVISEPWIFIGGALALKARGDEFKYGEYQFQKNASLRDVAETIIAGKVVQHQLTLAEGLTSEQIVARLLENPILIGNIREIPREGSLLPESYKFERGMTREQMIQRMQQAQARVVKELWDRRVPDLPIQTPEQFLILASIVEKETGKPEERTRVAAVFHNRLKQKMKLQSDPTIIYGLAGGKGSLGRPIMKSEIEQPTPYNTYVIPGLPPGPIANPGRATLEAVANPARTKELFFVADGTGGHAFADNYDQHLKNVARLRAIEQGRDPNAAAAPQAPAFAPTRAPTRPLQNTGRSSQAPAQQ